MFTARKNLKGRGSKEKQYSVILIQESSTRDTKRKKNCPKQHVRSSDYQLLLGNWPEEAMNTHHQGMMKIGQ